MARPVKNNAGYFSHDADMRNDLKVKALRRKYGHIGYSVYNMLIEVLTDSEYFSYELTELNYEMLAGDFDINTDTLKEIISYILSIGLMQNQNGFLSCKTLNNRLESVLSKRKRERKGVIADDNTINEGVIVDDNTQRKEKKRKENNIKENKSDFIDSEVKVVLPDRGVLFYQDLNDLQDELKSSQVWKEDVARLHAIRVDMIDTWIDIFVMHLKAAEDTGRHLKEYKSYFRNWLGVKIRENKERAAKQPERYVMPKPRLVERVGLLPEVIKMLESKGSKSKYDDELTDQEKRWISEYWSDQQRKMKVKPVKPEDLVNKFTEKK